MGGIGGKSPQRLIAQGFFQRFAVFIRGNMAHDDAQIGMIPLYLKQFLNAAVRAFQIGPIFKNIALKTVYRTTVEAGSAGETFVRGVRRRQVFSDFRFYTRFHSHTVGYGCSGVGKRGYSQKKTEEKCHDFHGLYDSQHNCSPTRYCQTACYFGGCELYKNITFGGLPCIQAT